MAGVKVMIVFLTTRSQRHIRHQWRVKKNIPFIFSLRNCSLLKSHFTLRKASPYHISPWGKINVTNWEASSHSTRILKEQKLISLLCEYLNSCYSILLFLSYQSGVLFRWNWTNKLRHNYSWNLEKGRTNVLLKYTFCFSMSVINNYSEYKIITKLFISPE